MHRPHRMFRTGPSITGPGITGPGLTGPGITGPGLTGHLLAGPLIALFLLSALVGCGQGKSPDPSRAPAAGGSNAADGGAADPAPAAPIAAGEAMTAAFDGEAAGQAPRDFAPLVGSWLIGEGEDGAGLIYNGGAGEPAPATDLNTLATALFGADGSLLTAAITATPLYAFCAYRPLDQMAGGRVAVRFRPDGSGDQAAGIVFGLRANGDYLVARANGPEGNLVLLSVAGGRRNLMAKQTDVTVAAGAWHDLRLTGSGTQVTAQVDDQPTLTATLPTAPAGRVGLWSVSDRAVAFDGFTVEGGR